MNECFLIGKIITDIDYKFVINSKNTAISEFKIQLINKSEINVKAFNNIADYCYQKLKKNNFVFIYGFLNSNLEILVKEMEIIYFS